ncbi:MAG: Excinuclease subunit domain protein [Rickettsiaceae bacterium]|jgi:putative endonuclease|nr:Excinuclease subunit domain protein [Rickettsiaceae bacterium]
MPQQNWFIYILQCADGTLYTGITTDVERRLSEHESGKGAKYTRGRGPLKIIYTETHENRSAASVREAEIKSMDKNRKLLLSNS